MGEERAAASKDEEARGNVSGVGGSVGNFFGFLGVERADKDGVGAGLAGNRKGHEEEVLAIGKELRPAVAGFPALQVESGDGRGCASSGGNTIENIAKAAAGSEEDDAVCVPSAATAGRGVAQSERGAAGEIEFLEFAAGEETEGFSVGGPEGEAGAVGIGERTDFAGTNFVKPELDSFFGVAFSGDGDGVPIGSDGHAVDGEMEGRGVVFGLIGRMRRTCAKKSDGQADGEKSGEKPGEKGEKFFGRGRCGWEERRGVFGGPVQFGGDVGGALPAIVGIFGEASLAVTSIKGGVDFRCWMNGEGMCRSRMAAMTLSWLLPSKARLPVSISKSTAPREKMSLRASASLPWICSGVMYCKVPTMVPVR